MSPPEIDAPAAETSVETPAAETSVETSAAETPLLSVCVACRREGDAAEAPAGARFFAALRDAASGEPVRVRPVQCLSVCKRPCTVALSAPGRYTYLFGDLDDAAGIAALIEGARVYAAQAHGYMLWRERPEPLRRGIVARLPPPDWSPEDGRHPR